MVFSTRSRTIRSPQSAALSVPSLLRPKDKANSSAGWTWRTDLHATQPYWDEWFTDLSAKFLACRVAKQLLLADHDYLDKPLTIGQMQGKFQFNVLTDTGHFIHEDAAERTAKLLGDFAARNMKPVLPVRKS